MTKQPKKKRSKKIESRDERMVGMLVEELRTFFQDLAPALPVAEANRFVQLVVIPPQNEYSGGSGQLYGLTGDGRVYVHKGSRTTYADGNWVRVPTLLVDPPPPSFNETVPPTGGEPKRGPLHHEWSAGPFERGFEFVVGSPRIGHRTILGRAEAKELCGMLEAWLQESGSPS